MAALFCGHCDRRVRGLSLFVAVGGRCRTLPFIVRCHASPVYYVKKGQGEGGRVTHLVVIESVIG